MNWDRIELNWRKYRPRAKARWTELSEEDLDRVDGQRDRLAACIAQRHGISRDEADGEIEAWRREVKPVHP